MFDMPGLGDIIKGKVRNSPLWRGVEANMIVEAANAVICDIFGAEIARYAKAVHVKNRVLTLACLSSAAAQEIRFHDKDIIGRINVKVHANSVEKIRYLA